jgi:hypothetical protein
MPLDEAYTLRALTRKLALTQRERDCGIRAVDADPSIEVRTLDDGTKRASFCGVLTCGKVWTCPACSARMRAERASRIARAVTNGGGRWQMLTITLRHRRGMALRELIAGLMKAWRRARQGGIIQRVWGDRVSASARAIEVTFGKNGWHPHVHVLLRTEEWSEAERSALLDRWQTCVRRELGDACVPSDAHALTWSDAFDGESESERAKYLSKLGLEISGAGSGKDGERNVWSIAERAGRGDAAARALWGEYQTATKGRRMLELDERAVVFETGRVPVLCAVGDDDEEIELPISQPEVPERVPLRIALPRSLLVLRLAERQRPTLLVDMLADVAQDEDPKACVRRWFEFCAQLVGAELPRFPEEHGDHEESHDALQGPEQVCGSGWG